jgi:hypothetical protein
VPYLSAQGVLIHKYSRSTRPPAMLETHLKSGLITAIRIYSITEPFIYSEITLTRGTSGTRFSEDKLSASSGKVAGLSVREGR